MDTALLLAGALFCQSYFDRDDPREAEVRALAESLYARADWRWAQVRPPMVVHGWDPEDGFLPYDWRGMNESMLVPILALGLADAPAGTGGLVRLGARAAAGGPSRASSTWGSRRSSATSTRRSGSTCAACRTA